MINTHLALIILISSSCYLLVDASAPKVMIAALSESHQDALPFLLGALESFNYDKREIFVWLHEEVWVDGKETREEDVPKLGGYWFGNHSSEFHHLSVHTRGARNRSEWNEGQSLKRRNELYEGGLELARSVDAGILMFLETKCLIFNPNLLQELIGLEKESSILAPMMIGVGKNSNFWCKMQKNGDYEYTNDCDDYRRRDETGIFEVASVHSCFIMFLNNPDSEKLFFSSKKLFYEEKNLSPEQVLSLSAREAGIKVKIRNDVLFGYILQDFDDNEEFDFDQIAYLHQEMQREGVSLPITKMVDLCEIRQGDKLNGYLDEVYLINLIRRKDRYEEMRAKLCLLGFSYTHLPATDGTLLSAEFLKENKITHMKNYLDPYLKRPMTFGEMGCFISHYRIWLDIIENQHELTLVLEDDVRFKPYFRNKLQFALNETKRLGENFDLLYIGRKPLNTAEEHMVEKSLKLVRPGYSYWTLGYVITLKGAIKLVNSQVLNKMLPVDEFLPIMFDKHPNEAWSSWFPKRELEALSTYPLLIEPVFYTGDERHVSDTDVSIVLPEEFVHEEL